MNFYDRMGITYIVLFLIIGVIWTIELFPWYVLTPIALLLVVLYLDAEHRRSKIRQDIESKNRAEWHKMQVEKERQKAIARAREAIRNRENH